MLCEIPRFCHRAEQKARRIGEPMECDASLREHMSHRKNPGNTKYVLDGHWFMEIDGNC